MVNNLLNFIKRTLAAVLLLSIALLSVSCSAQPSAKELMHEFVTGYGIEKPYYFKSAAEGESGYVPDNFLFRLFGDIDGSVSDFAVVFTSDLSAVGECSVLICYSEYDAARVSEAVLMRVDTVRSLLGSSDTSAADDAAVFRRGRIVVCCMLDDNARAKRLWDRIL